MGSVQPEHGLVLAGVLFAVGTIGLMARRNLLFVLMSLEIMLNAAGLAFIAAAARWGQPDGQVMMLFILVTAAAEVSVGLSLLIRVHANWKHLDSDAVSELKG